jgi:hypothetical protein
VTNYYVYYTVDEAQLEAVRTSVQQLFRTIEHETGVRGRWMKRRDKPSTCMEVYEGVRDDAAFDALLEREGSKLGSGRRVERFVCA